MLRSALLVLCTFGFFCAQSQTLELEKNIKFFRNPSDTLLKDVQVMGDSVFVTSLQSLSVIVRGEIVSSRSLSVVAGSKDFLRLQSSDLGMLAYNKNGIFLFNGSSWESLIDFIGESGEELIDMKPFNGYIYIAARRKVFRYNLKEKALDESIAFEKNLSGIAVNDLGVWVHENAVGRLHQVDLGLKSVLRQQLFEAGISSIHAFENKVFVGLFNGKVLGVRNGDKVLVNEGVSRSVITDITAIGDSVLLATGWSGFVDFINLNTYQVDEMNLRSEVGPDVLLSLDQADSFLYVVSGQKGLLTYKILWDDVNVSSRWNEANINEMSVFPNPGRNQFTLVLGEVTDQHTGPYTLRILDSRGVVVKSIRMNSSAGRLYSFDLQGFGKGIYILKLDGAGFQSVTRLIKY